jgi:small-conductance mechanosensitive channel
MNSQLQRFARAAEGRYFQADERQALLAKATALPRRLEAADQVQQHEAAIVQAVMGTMQQRHPESSALKGPALTKTQNDVQLVLRFNVQAMVLDDMRWLDDKVLFWLRTILAAGNFTPEFSRDCFTLLCEQVEKYVDPESLALLQPFLRRNVEVLSDIPEPAAKSA